MESRSIFLHRAVAVMSDGGTRRGTAAPRIGHRACWRVGRVGREIHLFSEPEASAERQGRPCCEAVEPVPPRKAPSQGGARPYRKPTQVGWQNTAKVNGRTFAKELGKLTL